MKNNIYASVLHIPVTIGMQYAALIWHFEAFVVLYFALQTMIFKAMHWVYYIFISCHSFALDSMLLIVRKSL